MREPFQESQSDINHQNPPSRSQELNQGLARPDQPPLVVDLDGTLCASDTLMESLWWIIRHKPFKLLIVLQSLYHGRVEFKRAVFESIDPRTLINILPWNRSLIKYLREQSNRGRRIILATASDIKMGKAIQAHFPFISKVYGSDPNSKTNLKGDAKANLLISMFGRGGFDYIGNDYADIPVWQACRNALVVAGFQTPSLKKKIEHQKPISIYFPLLQNRLKILSKALRIKQWSKNLLVFAPMLASHAYFYPEKWVASILTFIAFSLCASGTYLLNDLLDIEHDRVHHQKYKRPLALGSFPITLALGLAILLPLSGLAISLKLGISTYIAIYLLVTILYSTWLKKIAIVDIAVLASLYCLRIITGGEATHDPVSFWMAAFGGFLFVSLACIKRQAELLNLPEGDEENGKKVKTRGREYNLNDIALTRTIGVATGCIAPLVLALYLEANAGDQFYAHPEYLWGSCGLIFVWIMSLWRNTEQNELKDEDPISFSLTNKKSVILLALLTITLILATYVP